MRIASIGGGPGGLYFAIIMKRTFPLTEITVYERNRADDTFGWGVVFSKETLGNLREADPETYDEIEKNFIYWERIDTFYRGTKTTSTGHDFCGLARKKLLQILHQRCRELGVELRFEVDIESLEDVGPADLILAADGVNSRIRESLAAHFRPSIDWRRARFSWLGTTKRLSAFTFIFEETEHGLFQVHAYPFQDGLSTWIVECHEDVWRRAGLENATEEDTVAFCQKLFAPYLDGHDLLTNRSIWRTFPTVKNECWHHDNVVLVGDSAHTAHFSIGSGTKLAMEDSIALLEAFRTHGSAGIAGVLDAYEESRRVDVIKTQKAAQTSLEWFENAQRYLGQPPIQFNFNLMTRSKRITWDNLALRDPELIRDVAECYRESVGAPLDSAGHPPPPAFTPFRLRGLELPNRVVVSPMCQYSAVGGTPNDWHLVHLGSRAIGGAGLVMTEMTNVSADGRITPGCAGLWCDDHVTAWRRIVDFVHEYSASKIGIQLAHAGRKGSTALPWVANDVPLDGPDAWTTIAPSPIPFRPEWPAPRAMTRDDMVRVRGDFVRSVRLAERAGFDLIELHMAHGYLLSSFLSPLSNQRDDDYGGDLERRMRFPLEVFRAARETWPAEKPMSVRVSATDWMGDEGMTPEDTVVLARALREAGLDVMDVSTGGNVAEAHPEYGRMYQLPFAEKVRYEAELPVMTVGAILGLDHVNTIIAAGRADLCAMARPHLGDPYLTARGAADLGFPDCAWPSPYLPGRPRARD